MHKLKWVYDRGREPEIGASPQPVTPSNPRGAGRKPDGSRLAAIARGAAAYWTPRICRADPTHNIDGLCERYASSSAARCVQCAREEKRQFKARCRRIRALSLAAVASALGV